MKRIQILFTLLFIVGVAFGQVVKIAPVPNKIVYNKHNDDFTVCVRPKGGDWLDLFEYKVMVDLDNPQPASMVQFDFNGTVELRVKLNNGLINDIKIRPADKSIKYTQNENVIYFNLNKPSKLSLEINGDRVHNLHIFANELETEIPKLNDPDVIYFEAGFHTPQDIPGKAFNIPSNTTVYLAPGAILNGKLVCNRVENVRIIGRGILLEPERGFEITHSKNIEIDGITVINPTHYTVYGGETVGLKINNLKSFSCKGWSDGINLMSCSDIIIDDVFMRNSDDCIAIYAHRWGFYGDARNYKISNAVLWADVAHPINIGLHGDVEKDVNFIENLHFHHIDILEHDEDDRNYQGCIAFSVSDHNLVQNVIFEDIRVEKIQEGQLLNMRVLFNEKYSYGTGKGIRNVQFKNIFYSDLKENASIIEGYSDEYGIEDILFDNIVINGKKIKTFDEGNIKIGKHTKNINLK